MSFETNVQSRLKDAEKFLPAIVCKRLGSTIKKIQ
jgi:hypothetical protein